MENFIDWKFGSLIVSVIAVALSQLPPVILWFRPKRLLVEVHSRILITHRVGNPNISLYLSVHNNGGKTLRIISTSISIIRDGVPICELPAQNYSQDSGSNSTVLFVPYNLKPDETWAYTTNFLNFFDRETEKNYRSQIALLKSDIKQKLDKRPKSKEREMVVAEDNLVKPFLKLFDDQFIWTPAEYIIELKVNTSHGSASFIKKYRFTIFESDTSELKSYAEDYKTGGGLAYDLDRHVSVTIPLTEHDS